MHSKSVDSLSLTRAGFIEYFLVATKLVRAHRHRPALFLLYYPGLVPVELRSFVLGLLLFFGALTVIMFQALDVYSDDIFSNRLRFHHVLRLGLGVLPAVVHVPGPGPVSYSAASW